MLTLYLKQKKQRNREHSIKLWNKKKVTFNGGSYKSKVMGLKKKVSFQDGSFKSGWKSRTFHKIMKLKKKVTFKGGSYKSKVMGLKKKVSFQGGSYKSGGKLIHTRDTSFFLPMKMYIKVVSDLI